MRKSILIKFLLLLPLFWVAVNAYSQLIPGQGAQGSDGTDSTKNKNTPVDTTWNKVKPRTLEVSPYRVMLNYRFRSSTQVDITQIAFRDELERTDGFSQNLGQIGKPYKRYRYGAAAEFFNNQHYHNLLTGVENVYITNPETEISYYDTRTPYVNVQYGQGKQELASLEVTISQNVTPLLNVTLDYHRRQSNGSYLNNTTDHYNVFLSGNFHSPDEKYIAFGNLGYNELNDNLNGGVAQLYDFADLFGKRQQPVSLSDARLVRKYRDFYFKHFYRLSNDTMDTPHRLSFFNSVMRDEQENQYTDTSFASNIFSFRYPIYPTADSLFFYERSFVKRWKYAEGMSYRYSGFNFEMNHRLEVMNERLALIKDEDRFVMNRFTPTIAGEMEFRPLRYSLKLDYDLHRVSTNFFQAGNYASGNFFINLGKFQQNYKDKVPGDKLSGQDSVTVIIEHRPFSLFGSALYNQQNPTLFNSFFNAFPGNSLVAERDLQNQTMQHVKAGFLFRGKDMKGSQHVILGNSVSVSAFTSQTNQMIYYDTSMVLSQMKASEYMKWQGLEAKFRVHFGNFAIENQTVWQKPSTNLADSIGSWFVESQPEIYGKAGFYYENQDLKIASVIRAGVECYYQAGFKGWLFDPASQQFYPQNSYQMPGYPRIDIVFATQIKRAYLFIRAINVNEGFPKVGYFSTPFYPMLDRTIMFGVTWPFFD